MKFLVAATYPHKMGKVNGETKIRCNMVVSEEASLQAIEVIPMRRHNITSRSAFMNEVVTPFLATLTHKEIFTHNHGILEMEDMKFLVKYARPYFGYLTPETRVKIDDAR